MDQLNYQADGNHTRWQGYEEKMAVVDYRLIKYGNSISLLAYIAGLCLIIFSKDRKKYFYGICPLILRIASLIISVTLVWVYVGPKDVIKGDTHSVKYLTGYLSLLQLESPTLEVLRIVDHIFYIFARWTIVYQIFRVGVLIPLFLDYGRKGLR